MNAHHPHGVRLSRRQRRRRQRGFPLRHPIHIPHKRRKTALSVLLAARGIFLQKPQIGDPPFAVRPRRLAQQQPRLLIQAGNQPIGRRGGCQDPHTLQKRRKRRAFFAERILLLRRPAQGKPQRLMRRRCPDNRQIVGQQSTDRRQQCRQKRHLLQGVVDQAQQRQRQKHLGRLEKAAALVGDCRNPLPDQLVGIGVAVGIGGAEQDAEIAVSRRTLAGLFGHGQRLAKRADALRDQPCLCRVAAVLCLRPPGHDPQLRLIPLPRRILLSAGDKLLPLIIDNAAGLPHHQLAKQRVYAVRHLAAGAEIMSEQNRAGKVVAVKLRIAVTPPQKQLRHRLPEAVDALLDVADHKEVLLLPRQGGKQRILRGVGVLIFVHHDLVILRRQLLRQRRRRHGAVLLRRDEKRQRQMLEVGKIQQVALPLFLRKGGGKPADRPTERLDKRPLCRPVLGIFRFGAAKQRRQRLHPLFQLIPLRLYAVFQRLIRRLAHGAQRRLRQRRGKPLPLVPA